MLIFFAKLWKIYEKLDYLPESTGEFHSFQFPNCILFIQIATVSL